MSDLARLHPKIVVIDDDPVDIELLDRYLNTIYSSGYSLSKFGSWEEARDSIESHDLIFLDYYLGSSDAKSIIAYIRAKKRDIPIIVLTGRGDEYVAVDVMKTGADDYMNKNELSPAPLRRAINYALSQQKTKEEKKRLEEALKHSQKLEALGTLAGGIAHDFNNMFAAVTGYLDLLKLRVEDEKSLKYINSLIQVTDNMSDLIRRLLSFSQGDLAEKSVGLLNDVVQDALMILEHTAPKSIKIETSIPDEEMVIYSNRTMIQQTILNICLNGIEAMPEGGSLKVDCTRIDLDRNDPKFPPELKEGTYYRISVSDTGTGIKKEDHKKIFEPFFTTKSLGTKKGTGLGLALSWQSIREHEGIITFSSIRSEGSTFTIYLPASKVIPTSGVNDESIPFAPAEETVLIIDEEHYVRESLQEMLQYLGYRTLTAATSLEGLEILKQKRHRVEGVILDPSIPGGGLEYLKSIRFLSPQTGILICESQSSLDMGLIENATLIYKPIHIEKLAICINNTLQKRS